MKENNIYKEEISLKEKLKYLLMEDIIEEEESSCDAHPQQGEQPAHSTQLLLEQLHNKYYGNGKQPQRLTTKREDTWERYPLEALLHLLWKQRNTETNIRFMRGNAGLSEPPIPWEVVIQKNYNSSILLCYDEARCNYLYLSLSENSYEISIDRFMYELQDFLEFEEDSIWLFQAASVRVKEEIT